jgi:hypothetical protein
MHRCFALVKAVTSTSHRSCASSGARQREPALTLWCLLIGCVTPMQATLSIEAVRFTWCRPLWGTPASLRLGVICTPDLPIVRHATSPSEAPRRSRPESQHPTPFVGNENDNMTSDDNDDNQFQGVEQTNSVAEWSRNTSRPLPIRLSSSSHVVTLSFGRTQIPKFADGKQSAAGCPLKCVGERVLAPTLNGGFVEGQRPPTNPYGNRASAATQYGG